MHTQTIKWALCAALFSTFQISTALAGDGVAGSYAGYSEGNRNNKLYFFDQGVYARWDIVADRLDPGYPKNIPRGWPGLPNQLDAATYGGYSQSNRNNKLYFFKDGHYWRWNIETDRLDPGYPKAISAGWRGLPNGLDAAVYAGNSNGSRNNKLYFFKDNLYWRWDIETDRVDAGYPKSIANGWLGLPNHLEAAIYAGFSQGGRDNKLYFFKDRHYWRWNIARDRLDAGYPKLISQGWPGFE